MLIGVAKRHVKEELIGDQMLQKKFEATEVIEILLFRNREVA
jgi:hypothetical protein